jgi:DNA polymerase-3 subunit delta
VKIAPKALKEFISYPQQYAGALIYGVDEGQVRLLVRQIAENFMGKDAEAINRIEFSDTQIQDDPARLADELAAFSLLGGKRAVCLRDAGDWLAPMLDQALSLRAPDNFLIAYCHDALNARSKLRSYFERHAQLACIACYKDEGANLLGVIRDTLRAYGIKTDAEVIDYLAHQLQGDRQVILNELEKISLYLGESQTLLMEDAILLTSDSRETSLDALTHAVAENNRTNLCQLSDTLLAEGMQPLVIVRSVMRYLRKLEEVAQMRYNGQGLDQAIGALKPPVFFKHKATFRRHATRWGLSKLQDAFSELHQLELTTKREAPLARSLLSAGLLRVASLSTPNAKAA